MDRVFLLWHRTRVTFTASSNPTEPIKLPIPNRDTSVSERLSLVIIPIKLRRQSQLPQIVYTLDPVSRRSAPRKSWKEQRRKHSEDRDRHEQLHQSKSKASVKP
jgi:hypothetical protein